MSITVLLEMSIESIATPVSVAAVGVVQLVNLPRYKQLESEAFTPEQVFQARVQRANPL